MRNSPENIHFADRVTEEQEDPRETQARVLVEEITLLRKKAATKEDYDVLLAKMKQLERLYEANSTESEMREARELLGEDFLGPEEVKKAFGIEISENEIPEIPYSKEDLEQARDIGEMLILRMTNDSAGVPLTMEHLMEIAQPTLTEKEGKILYSSQINPSGQVVFQSDAWYRRENFAVQDRPYFEWKLVRKELVPDSTDKDYIEQTKVLFNYLSALGALTYQEREDYKKLEQIEKFMNENYEQNWKAAAKKLSELLINKNHRRTPVEAMYDWIIKFKNGGERLLKNEYDWTNAVSSAGGHLVDFGYADADGASVNGGKPGHSLDLLGVVSSR